MIGAAGDRARKHLQNIIKKSALLVLREDVLPGPKEAHGHPCTQGTNHQFFWQFYMVCKRELCPGQIRFEVLILFPPLGFDLIKIKLRWQGQGILTFTLQILSRYLTLAMPPPADPSSKQIAERAKEPQCWCESDVSKRVRIWLRDPVIWSKLNLHFLMKMAVIHILFSL